MFTTGPLATQANQIQYGGETVGGYTWIGTTLVPVWPMMGSGYPGYYPTVAAQHSRIWYYTNPNGGNAWSSLTAALDTSANCYMSTVSGTTLYYGGIGGAQFC